MKMKCRRETEITYYYYKYCMSVSKILFEENERFIYDSKNTTPEMSIRFL